MHLVGVVALAEPGHRRDVQHVKTAAPEDALVRDLADYDTRFGVDFDPITGHDVKEVAS